MADNATELASKAYSIYRGMKIDPPLIPHWDDLPREQQGLLEWVVRWTQLNTFNQSSSRETK
jgi:hypothetical protein